MSKHTAEVVSVTLEKHPNADSLSVIRVFGFTVCGRTDDWKDRDRGIYITPDTIVDVTRPEFYFLAKEAKNNKYRVRAKKLRGIPSFGLLIPAPENADIGQDFFEQLNLEHYEPPIPTSTGGDDCEAPRIKIPCKDNLEFSVQLSKYDIENFRRYNKEFVDGETVWVSEKIHGANARYMYADQMYCGSRANWKKDSEKSCWWQAFRNTPQVEKFCRDNQNLVLYGEVYGQVQDLKYGKNGCHFIAFDAFNLETQKFVDVEPFLYLMNKYEIPTVPTIFMGEYNFDKILEFAEGNSLISGANHVREGCVVKPLIERRSDSLGRIILKAVGLGYYERKNQ